MLRLHNIFYKITKIWPSRGVLKVDLDLTGLEFVQCPAHNNNNDNDNNNNNNNNNSSPLLFHLTHNCPQHTQVSRSGASNWLPIKYFLLIINNCLY